MAASISVAFATAFIVLAAGVGLARPQVLRLADDCEPAPDGDDPSRENEQRGRVDLSQIATIDLSPGAATLGTGVDAFWKRLIDICAAVSLLALFAPMLAVVAAAIKLDSPGPALYRQRRIGLNGKEFEIYKFRSMVMDAEKDGACWAAAQDPRITRVGRFIRKTRIDEIPQAINILRGEMSFVGPRPERPEFVGMLEREIAHYDRRHLVKPGITGWAQVKYVYTASVEGAREKLSYDLFYIRHYSLLLDLKIIAMTIRVALLGIGSR